VVVLDQRGGGERGDRDRVVGYAVGFSRPLAGSVLLQFALAQALLWGLCLLNVLGIRQSARLQVVVMCTSAMPMLLVSLAMLPHARAANYTPFAPHGWGSLAAGAALVVWAYSGVESATVPAEEVQRPTAPSAAGRWWGTRWPR
jgi:APA family basic amino acid/polyamine antiporter